MFTPLIPRTNCRFERRTTESPPALGQKHRHLKGEDRHLTCPTSDHDWTNPQSSQRPRHTSLGTTSIYLFYKRVTSTHLPPSNRGRLQLTQLKLDHLPHSHTSTLSLLSSHLSLLSVTGSSEACPAHSNALGPALDRPRQEASSERRE